MITDIIVQMLESVISQLQGVVVELCVVEGATVRAGSVVAVVESMKLHHDVLADATGTIAEICVTVGESVRAGERLVTIEPSRGETVPPSMRDRPPLPHDAQRDDLRLVLERHQLGHDAGRVEAVAKRHGGGRRTARENVADLVDPDSFVEYGPLAVAAQRKRRTHDDLVTNTPADGMIGGVATVNAGRSTGRDAHVVVLSYDYMVLAGTQGVRNHLKKDRLFELAERLRLPVIVFAEGGGGRPGDTDAAGVSGLDCLAFLWFGRLSGKVPLIAIVSGFCFGGNAALAGCSDVVIATPDANIGMGGPAMIEGGGLGTYDATEIGPISVHRTNGVVDIVADDEEHAVALAKQYLSYFQGSSDDWSCAEQELLRHIVPIDRKRAYDVDAVIVTMFDTGSVLELRREFGRGMIIALARIEGRPVGVIANDPGRLSGAVTSDGADKAARFMQLCEAHGLPIVTLVDTPGMMVGPEVEAGGLVRHSSRLFVTAANLSVPFVSVVLRKAYGLGAQAMMGGSTKAPLACVAWPTGEFGGMGIEGAVRLAYRKELNGCTSASERDTLFDDLVGRLYDRGKAISIAEHFEIDDVIDPSDTRRWLASLLASAPASCGNSNRGFVDPW